MTSPARTSITAFPRGHEFSPATFTLTAAEVAAYLDAVGDENDYGDTVPPLAAAALGLEALQGEIALPEGSLHTGQEVEHARTLQVGERLTMRGRVAQRSERQGYVICVIEFEIVADAGLDRTGEAGVAVRARSTIVAPAGVAPADVAPGGGA
ncbi:MAG: MaoC family dehydratase N-terminal domain-containing protein [Chloroflexi bacterium]|nr:MaoC family dehydratase N-terminal domain-containing protein [Chloroflexota bacterium]